MTIDNFIKELSECKISGNVINIYRPDKKGTIRANNLRLYLTKMKTLNPTLMLIGEAPGYRGCGQTGIPFTSEMIVSKHNFFTDDKYQPINIPNALMRENSAKTVWDAIDRFTSPPLLWNIFPFHPHKPNQPHSNRKPSALELKEGIKYYEMLNEIFNPKKIATIGLVAKKSLSKFRTDFIHLRHPSHGGAIDFRRGLKTIQY